jgi:hypothetical protein
LVPIYAVAISTIAGHHIQVDSGGGLTVIDSPAGSAGWLAAVQADLLGAVQRSLEPVHASVWLSRE